MKTFTSIVTLFLASLAIAAPSAEPVSSNPQTSDWALVPPAEVQAQLVNNTDVAVVEKRAIGGVCSSLLPATVQPSSWIS